MSQLAPVETGVNRGTEGRARCGVFLKHCFVFVFLCNYENFEYIRSRAGRGMGVKFSTPLSVVESCC